MALQAVEPKCEVSLVWLEPQRGQGTAAGARGMKRSTLWAGVGCPVAAVPYTHLPLPTNREVLVSGVGVAVKKK